MFDIGERKYLRSGLIICASFIVVLRYNMLRLSLFMERQLRLIFRFIVAVADFGAVAYFISGG